MVRVLDHVRPGRADQAGRVSVAPQQEHLAVVVRSGRRGGRLAVFLRAGTAVDEHAKELHAAEAVHPGRRLGRVQLGAGRVARVFAHVRPQGTADEASVLLSERGRQTGAPQALRPQQPAAAQTKVQPAPVRGLLVVRGRAAQTAVVRVARARRRRQRVRVQRARPQRVHILSRHGVRPTRRIPHAVRRQRKLFRSVRTEVSEYCL